MLEEVKEQTWPPGDSQEGLQAMGGFSCSPSPWNASPAHHSLSRGWNHFKDAALIAVFYWDHRERGHHWTQKRAHQIHGTKEILPELIGYVELTIKGTAYFIIVCVCARAQSCPTLCNPMDCSLPGFSSMGFSRQESWSGLPFPSPGDCTDPGIKPVSLMSPAFAGRFFTTSAPEKSYFIIIICQTECCVFSH